MNPRDYYAPFFVPGPDAWVIQRSDGEMDPDDSRYFPTEDDAWDAIDEKSVICGDCSGSGEGRHEGTICRTCMGRGQR